MTVTFRPPVVNQALLREIVQKIVAEFHPRKVILFGSHAWGKPGMESDVDLLVVMESTLRPHQRSAEVATVCQPPQLPMDILVRTPKELEARLKLGDPFIAGIMESGRVLYER